jgi:1-acyl-sn-glycerol-3-phosphate acyltransferase
MASSLTPSAVTSIPLRLVRFTRLLLHLLRGVATAALIFPFIDHARQQDTIRHWAKRLLAIVGVSINVDGALPRDQGAGCVIAANHISWLDIFVVHAICPARFVAKSEIRGWPVVGWLCERTGTLFIERGKRHHTAKINEVMRDVLADGDPVALFPEGTTTRGDALKKFHSSLFQAVVATGAPLHPAGIRYLDGNGLPTLAVAYVDEMSLLDSILCILRERKIQVSLRFAPVIDSDGKSRRELALECELAIANVLQVTPPHTAPETVPDLQVALP